MLYVDRARFMELGFDRSIRESAYKVRLRISMCLQVSAVEKLQGNPVVCSTIQGVKVMHFLTLTFWTRAHG